MDLRTVKTLTPREYHARRSAEIREARAPLSASSAAPSICGRYRAHCPRQRGLTGNWALLVEHLILDRRIRKELEVLEGIWEDLAATDAAKIADDRRERTFIGYKLHNLYNAIENVFRNIARTFGNRLGDQSGWHAELLDRMRLDLTPLRPAVIDEETFALLDELRRFRHVFRAVYTIELDSERLALVLRKALALRRSFPGQIEEFLRFLESLET